MKKILATTLLLFCFIPVTASADPSDLEQRITVLEKKVALLEQQLKNPDSSQLGVNAEAIKQKLNELQFENKDKIASELAGAIEDMKKTLKKGDS